MGRYRPSRWLAALALVVVGAPESSARETTASAPPGRLIDVGGYRLHLHCLGEGQPTVVLDAGAGHWSIHFAAVQSALSRTTRVCAYDRAGLGWSDATPGPRTSRRMADEMHALLHAAGAPPPLLLVGHSLGGYNVRIYQATHPEEVGGLVLLDAAHEEQWERLPPIARELVAAAASNPPAGEEGPAAEMAGAFESAREVPAGRSLGDLPLVVLTARRSFEAFAGSGIPIAEANAVWMTLQDELAALSSRSVHLWSEAGHHDLNATDPAAVIGAVERAIEMVRSSPTPPAGLAVPAHLLPATSTPAVDQLLREIEVSYRSMDVDGFVDLFTADCAQLDVNRRVHVTGREAWRAWTKRINSAHLAMDRVHRGRAVVGDVVAVEIEWSGTVRGEALGTPGRDRRYRYTGLGLLELENGRIRRQVLYGDFATLSEQLGGVPPPPPEVESSAR